MTTEQGLDPATAVLLLLGAIVVLPFLTMGFGFGGTMGGGMMGGGMMGGYGTGGGLGSVLGPLVQLAVLAVVLGGGYLVLRRSGTVATGRADAVEELRLAYARGDLNEEEFEHRRATLGRDESS